MPGMETAAGLAGTAFTAALLVLTAIHAGPLWRDEINTLNVAQMSSLKEFWNNMPFESFPPLWPLLLRGCGLIGLAGSDTSIRLVGLGVGLLFLVSLWLCSRWIGSRAPILSIALLGCLPAFVFIVGANRAYGLASCLLVLSFGTIWRMLEFPSRARVLLAGFICFLFAHCVYYDGVFLGAMLAGGAMVVIRRRQWKTLVSLAGIGVLSAASLVIYLPIIRRGSAYVPLVQLPSFNSATLWNKLGEAMSARSSAQPGASGPEIWLWIGLLLGGSVAALVVQRKLDSEIRSQKVGADSVGQTRHDLTLFCVVSMFLGIGGYLAFLMKLQYPTQSWYYVGLLCLCAISLDGLLGANWPKLRPWGLLRIGFMLVMMTWGARSAWEESHTRRSNVDLIAAVIEKNASEGDFIVVQSVWEGITFNRYYHGPVHWVTVPPVDSHKVHRNDLVFEKMNEPDPISPVLREIISTLQNRHSVWLVGNKSALPPDRTPSAQPVKWFGVYFNYWNAQVSSVLVSHALREQVLEMPVAGPVCCLENLALIRFAGYKPGAADRLSPPTN